MLNETQMHALQDLADQAVALLEMRLNLRLMADNCAQLIAVNAQLQLE